MIATVQPSLLARWRRQLGRSSRRTASPRPMTAFGYLANGPALGGLIEIQNLVLVVLYDQLHADGKLSLNLAGFSGRRVPWGVQWGGALGNLFFKNLLLRPRPEARGRCIDTSRVQLLELALHLDRQLDCHKRYQRLVQGRQLTLPKLWAGFRKPLVPTITADGPELFAAAQRCGLRPNELLGKSWQDYEGLALAPLEWVSHDWQQITAVFADVAKFPDYQVVPLHDPETDLQGYRGASQFDFCHTRFRNAPTAIVAPQTDDVCACAGSASPVAV